MTRGQWRTGGIAVVAFAAGVLVGAKACGPDGARAAATTAPAEALTAPRAAVEAPSRERPDAPATPTRELTEAVAPSSPRDVDAGPAVQPDASHAHGCPVFRATSEASPQASARRYHRVELELFNDCDEPVLISWIDFHGAEQRSDFVTPQSSWTTRTFHGHVFRVRAADARRSFVKDVVVPRATRARAAVCGCAAEPATAALAGGGVEIVEPAAPGPAETPRCLAPFDPQPASGPAASVLSSERRTLRLRNTCADTRVRLQWVQFDGGLRSAELFEPGEVLPEYVSFVGHRFRLFDEATGRWLRDFEIDGGAEVDFCPCR